ncbi:MAG: DUF362 domain-containing protein [Nanoarchaeota archaeon]|nr:DUF362 domain-containing protein [Nanoarchaeota archaeon]
MKKERVSIVQCKSYKQKEVDKTVLKAFNLAKITIPKRKKVFIKPNVVGNFGKNQTAITTSPEIIEAICKILKKNNCKIYIGDSPFTNAVDSFRASKIEKIAKKYGKLIIFEQDKLIKIRDNKAKILKNFNFSKTLLNADVIINVPKLKTHQLTKFTGALKNLYGCIPGGMKQRLHLKASTEKKLSNLLVDVYQNIKPEINIIDGIIGMEGEGPTAGEPKKVGYILASKSAVSLDVVSSKLIGYNPRKILAIKEAVKRKLGSFKYELVGLEKLPLIKFKKPFVRDKLTKKIKDRFLQRPILVDEKKCIKCGLCSRKCPAKAIKLTPYPVVDKKKCIRCFCCMEICPQHALKLKE